MDVEKRKLGTYIIAAFFINVFAIMSVGGVCILMVRDMVHNIKELQEESTNVFRADEINNKIHKTIYAIDHAIIDQDKKQLDYAEKIIRDIEHEVDTYKRKEETNVSPHLQNKTELLLLGQIQANLKEIKQEFEPLFEQYAAIGELRATDMQQLVLLGVTVQNLAASINKVHFEIISSLVTDSFKKMYFILFLYLVSSFVGIMASCVGYIVLTRNTVSPIKSLAQATQKVADGDLSIRVDTASQTEIGTLYRSFNTMAEKLEEHERRREDFSRELERQVRERTAELEDSNASLTKAQAELIRMEKIATLGQMATAVNHEIKTPLNSLYMNLQLLTKKIKKIELAEEATRDGMLNVTTIIDKEIVRINEILEEFVKYARFAPPNLKPTDLNRVITDLTAMISQNAEKAKVAIDLKLAEGLGEIMLDEKKIIQAFLNLCVNAIQAMAPGGRLSLASAREGDDVVIRISDTGKGIAAEDLGRIFDPFFTKREGGMGFGLPIVQRIIEDHKGSIVCRSKIGEFTEFEIRLPFGQAPVTQG